MTVGCCLLETAVTVYEHIISTDLSLQWRERTTKINVSSDLMNDRDQEHVASLQFNAIFSVTVDLLRELMSFQT